MPIKIDRLMFSRRKLTTDIKRLHAKIQDCNEDTEIGVLVSYRKALEDCWTKYDTINDEIEGAKDNPCDDSYITETGITHELFLEAQSKLLRITPANKLHESVNMYNKKKSATARRGSSHDDETSDEEEVQSLNETIISQVAGPSAQNLIRVRQPTASSTPQNYARTDLMPQIKLPPLKIKVFSGNKLDWPEFKAICEATFSNMDPINRFRYLKSQLDGEAARAVKHLPITNTSYDQAWLILEKKYDNERAIINANLARLIDLPSIQRESADSLKLLVDTTNECLAAVQSYGIDTLSWCPLLILILSRKLDNSSITHWEEHIQGAKLIPPLETFLEFLEIRINILETASTNNIHRIIQTKHNTKVLLATEKASKCYFCPEEHRTFTCPLFNSKSVQERKNLVIAKKLCFNCLNKQHNVNACTSKFSCKTCSLRHHSLLHVDQTSNLSQASESTEAFNGNLIHSNGQVMLATAMVQITHNSKSMLVKALIDQGSMTNLITKRVCDVLQLPTHRVDVPITGVGGSVTCKIKKGAKCTLRPHFESGESLQLNALVLPKITTLNLVEINKQWKHINNIQLADPCLDKNGRIDILIGAETFAEILLNGVVKGKPLQPIAQNTKFGWILSGKTSFGHTPVIPIMSVMIENEAIADSIKQFWESEEIPSEKHLTPDEIRAEEIFISTTKRHEDGRYMVKLPFKSNPLESIGESFHIANKRLANSQARLNRQPEFKAKYNECIQEYLDLNQMELANVNEKPYYYLPHHAVIKDSSTTTKIRPVFDASCKTSNGNSLNSELIIGPTIQSDLFSLIIHWRKFQYAITGDIEKMYRQIWVYPEDTNYQRILWQPPNSQTINSYRLKTVTFGVASAPFLAIRSLHQVGEDIKLHKPDLADKIQKQFYVDDFLDSSPTEQEAKQNLIAITEEMAKFGMKLRKWKSNNVAILNSIPPSEREVEENQNSTFKTLGIQWQPSTDMFVFLPMDLSHEISFTKRAILSDISKLFDPLGWLSPCIILAKMFMQKLWLVNLDWDVEIPEDLRREWISIRSQFQTSSTIKIPRWVGLTEALEHLSLQGFCDASEKAYACVVYIRIEHSIGSVSRKLIAAKTRVAPLNNVSIPKLELNGALLLVKLMRKVQEALRMPSIKQVAWTDSAIVLCWLSDHPSRWKTYVANRVAKIQSLHQTNEWRHVSSKQNPADCASRGLIRNELEDFNLWWNGPEFLGQEEALWPKNVYKRTNLEEKKTNKLVCFMSSDENTFIERFSSYSRMLRVTLYCLKWLFNYRNKKQNSLKHRVDLNYAENQLIRMVQLDSFKEIHQLENNKEVDRKSSIRNLDPFIDKNGILRVNGRLKQSSLSEEEKHPIILPAKHHFTTILIRHTHIEQGHGGLAITLQRLRQRFWILNGKTVTNSIIRRCVPCFRFRSKPLEQKMGDLPAYRMSQTIPFMYTGVDYAGFFNIKTSQRKNAPFIKGYVSVFICLTTRALHLELVSDLSAEQFLKAFKRFVSRRGIPSKMYSDNGTNFVKASKLLNDMFDQTIRQNLEENEQFVAWLNSNRIQWSNIPPHAPHFGGWESGVKLMKHHLKRILGDVRLTFEDFNTLIIEIEAIVNSRPLWAIPSKVDEFEALTPGHFLVFRALNTLPEPNLAHLAINRLNQYQYLCRLVSDFWKLWSKEYFHQFQTRNKWKDSQPNVKLNQIVLIMEDNESPTQWSMGRIVNIIKGRDNLVRVAEIMVSNKIIKRSIHRLSLLPIADNLN